MKKLLLFLFPVIFFAHVQAQSSTLLHRNWQIERIITASQQVLYPAVEDAHYYLEFSKSGSSFAWYSKICEVKFGDFSHDALNSTFTLNSIHSDSDNCTTNGDVDFQNQYFQFLTQNSGSGNTFTYQISPTSSGYTMIVTNASGVRSYFRNTYPSSQLSNAEWRLDALEINGVHEERPSQHSANSYFQQSLLSTYWNTTEASLGYSGTDAFFIKSGTTTLWQSDNAAINSFDDKYHGAFLRKLEGWNNPFVYAISGNVLTIENENGDKAIFGKTPTVFGTAIKNKTWYITSLTFQDQTYVPTLSDQPLTFSEDSFQAAYFNVLNATATYGGNTNTFDVYNVDLTFVTPGNPAIANFGGAYLEGFFGQGVSVDGGYSLLVNGPFSYVLSNNNKTLTVTNSLGDIAVYSDEILSISEAQQMNTTSVFPVPAIDYLTVKHEVPIYSLVVTDLSGKRVLQQKTDGRKTYSLNIKTLTSGVYFITVNGENTKKFIKK